MFFLAFADTIQLLPDFSMFIHIAMILLMIWVLNRTFFRPINRILNAREKNKGGQASEAQNILKEVSEKDAEYKAGLLEARNEGYELIEKERNGALEQKSSEMTGAKKEIAEKVESELNELEEQTTAARNKIDEEAEKMAEKISSNILKAA